MSLTTEELEQMKALAQGALAKAYSPYSKFSVGTCLQANDGQYYVGCNIENVSYSLTLCAEACAVSNMVIDGGHKIQNVVLVSSGENICPPCGACRQILAEFSTPDTMVYMYDAKGQEQHALLQHLLPLSFNQSNLEH